MFRNPLSDGLVVLVILLLFFGPKRLPMLSRSIGESIREFKGGISSGSSEDEADDKPQLNAHNGQGSGGAAQSAPVQAQPVPTQPIASQPVAPQPLPPQGQAAPPQPAQAQPAQSQPPAQGAPAQSAPTQDQPAAPAVPQGAAQASTKRSA